ncbi:Cytochrome c552 [Delftia tsuruhatensis]|uniref:c-type cytochrome n=1 Tax=Delftia tsuruhatensis TaxID=180282 RepID=UPI001E7D1A5C|nr:c-type cytochrome [Delftia tsuruhatensis]CAB5702368.1 Cytochrome c552 [Delftia tsuruhatensis]CAC9691235.1 Cytochrome c552 [Delftia tsuruhatensis]
MDGHLHPDGDEDAPRRPRWLGWALVVFMLLVALGVFNIGWRIMRGAVPAPVPAASAPADARIAAGKALVEGSDCMRCHGLARHYVGPAYQQIADRYRDRADAAEYLARRIREGGAGEWGRAIMPRHPQLTEAQSLLMAGWLLSLPGPSTSAP